VTGLDQSAQMLEIARERIPGGRVVQGDAVPLPFEDGSFDRVFTGHFYGHLRAGARERFVAEALRVARQLVVVDSHVRPDHDAEEEQERSSTTAPCTGSTSATSPAPGWRRSCPARCCTTATGS
jgi:ubiquinone/menaquinone biosynthesis C-methylase UbiE